MPSKRKEQKPISAEAIARLADKGEDISRFFNKTGRMVRPAQRASLDSAPVMLKELERRS